MTFQKQSPQRRRLIRRRTLRQSRLPPRLLMNRSRPRKSSGKNLLRRLMHCSARSEISCMKVFQFHKTKQITQLFALMERKARSWQMEVHLESLDITRSCSALEYLRWKGVLVSQVTVVTISRDSVSCSIKLCRAMVCLSCTEMDIRKFSHLTS